MTAAPLILLSAAATGQGTNRPTTTRTYGIRVEATGYVRWNKSPLDPSGGTKTYWLHLSSAEASKRTTGGFNLEMSPRMNATATNMVTSPMITDAQQKAPGGPPAITSKVSGKCEMGGKNYKFEIELVGNKWNPPAKPGGRGKSTPGSIKIRILTPGATPAQSTVVLESQVVERAWVQFNDRRNVPAVSSGGAVAPFGVVPPPGGGPQKK